MKQSLPLKRTFSCTKNISVKVETELKDIERRLGEMGIDTPELLRKTIRKALKDAIELMEKKAA